MRSLLRTADLDQADNRLHTEQAILVALLGRRLIGRVGSPEHAVYAVER